MDTNHHPRLELFSEHDKMAACGDLCPGCKNPSPDIVTGQFIYFQALITPQIDHASGDMVCRDCGLVIADRMIDEGAEWRAFSDGTW